ARRCHDELLVALERAGYPPVRLGVQSMSLTAPHEQAYVDLLQGLKRLMDPGDVLAPGRYDFRHRWSPTAESGARETDRPLPPEPLTSGPPRAPRPTPRN